MTAFIALVVGLFWAGNALALTIVAWNMEWFPGRSPHANAAAKQKHIEDAQQVLASLKPDIFLAEEVADWTSFEKLVSVVPGLTPHTISTFRDATGVTRQQVCIASRLSANSTWSESFKRGWADPPRGFAFAALTLPDGKLLLVYAVHLKSNLARSELDSQHDISKREDAAGQLLTHTEQMMTLYKNYEIKGVVIGGDFNTNTDDKQYGSEGTIPSLEKNGFWNTWTGIPRQHRLTWTGSSRYQPTTFDYLFLKGLGKPTASLGSGAIASDHNPVSLNLVIK